MDALCPIVAVFIWNWKPFIPAFPLHLLLKVKPLQWVHLSLLKSLPFQFSLVAFYKTLLSALLFTGSVTLIKLFSNSLAAALLVPAFSPLHGKAELHIIHVWKAADLKRFLFNCEHLCRTLLIFLLKRFWQPPIFSWLLLHNHPNELSLVPF